MAKKSRRELAKDLQDCYEKLKSLQGSRPATAIKPLHPVLAYIFRTIGAATLSIGGAGIMLDISFLWSALFVCLGLTLLIIDPWIEPSLRSYTLLLRTSFSLVFVTILILFLSFVVFLPAPLKLTARDFNGAYLPKTKSLYGIEWHKEYSDLRVVFINPTGFAYKNLDFDVEPVGLLVAAEAQTTNLSGVQLFNTENGPDQVTVTLTDKNGKKSYGPQSNIHLAAGTIRVLCDTLPKKSDFEIILAVRLVPPGVPASNPIKAIGSDVREPAKIVHIYGTYQSRAGRPRTINETIKVKLM